MFVNIDSWSWVEWSFIILILGLLIFVIIYLYMTLKNFSTSKKYEYGIVLSKEYNSSYTQMMPIVHSTGKLTLITHVPIFHPESWTAKIKGIGGKEEIFIINITEEEYKKWKVGIRILNPYYKE